MNLVTAFLSGLIFGAGLILSGMSNPAKVLAFLDVTGAWDPSLLFVMAGAILVAAVAFRVARTRLQHLVGSRMHVPGAGRSAPLNAGPRLPPWNAPLIMCGLSCSMSAGDLTRCARIVSSVRLGA